MKILVLMGGHTEREVSLMTGKKVIEAINALGHKVDVLDIQTNDLLTYNFKSQDLIFNALHGGIGENGCLQGFFDSLGITYTGSGVLASSIAMNKILSKIIFFKNGINVAKDTLVNLKDFLISDPIKRPYVLKPVDGGSSIDTEIIDLNFDKKSIKFKNSSSDFFVEEFIEGREFSVAVMGDEVLGIIEIAFSESFYNYHAKYKSSETKYVFPIDLNTRARTKIEEDALIAHKSIGCKGLTRSDFIVPYDKPDQPIILEINTLPGLTSHSLVPKIALNSGISYKELISRIISEAID